MKFSEILYIEIKDMNIAIKRRRIRSAKFFSTRFVFFFFFSAISRPFQRLSEARIRGRVCEKRFTSRRRK